MDWIAELARMMPPPAQEQRHPAPAAADWAQAEAALGRAVPPDYKAFMDQWGAGSVNDFIHLFAPGDAFPAMRMPQATLGPAEAYETLKSHTPEFYAMPVFPADGSLMAFGVSDFGDYLGWIVGPEAPETWPVGILGHEEGTAEIFDMGFTEFMTGFVTGDLRPDVFHEKVWREAPLPYSPRPPES